VLPAKKNRKTRGKSNKKKGREESPYEKAQQLCSLLLLLLHHRRIHSGQMGAVDGRERAVIGRLNGRTLFEYFLKAHPTLGGVCFVGDCGSCGRSHNASDGDHDDKAQRKLTRSHRPRPSIRPIPDSYTNIQQQILNGKSQMHNTFS
jgi:hypothetical protein